MPSEALNSVPGTWNRTSKQEVNNKDNLPLTLYKSSSESQAGRCTKARVVWQRKTLGFFNLGELILAERLVSKTTCDHALPAQPKELKVRTNLLNSIPLESRSSVLLFTDSKVPGLKLIHTVPEIGLLQRAPSNTSIRRVPAWNSILTGVIC